MTCENMGTEPFLSSVLGLTHAVLSESPIKPEHLNLIPHWGDIRWTPVGGLRVVTAKLLAGPSWWSALRTPRTLGAQTPHGQPVTLHKLCNSKAYRGVRHFNYWESSLMLLLSRTSSTLDRKEIKPVNPEYSGLEINPEYSLEGLMLKLRLQYLAAWCKELT